MEIALLGVNLESNVKRGENSGRKPQHDFSQMKAVVNGPSRTGSSGYNINRLARQILETRASTASERALLVGISGIDASGKGFISMKVANALRAASMNVALIGTDDWLNQVHIRINRDNPGEDFYKYALRLNEMFERLILPLRDKRNVVVAGGVDARVPRQNHVQAGVNALGSDFRDIDIILLEGIFLFKRAYRDQFNLRIWIDCSFETAMQRAIARGQEGLPPAETQRDFETIYFPAQRIHFAYDNPREAANLILVNDDSPSVMLSAR